MADEFVEKVLQKARVLGSKIRNRIISNEGSIKVDLTEVAISSGLGIVTFPLSLGALQTWFFRPLRMTSNIRVLGSVCGGISVLISGSTASLAFLSSTVMLKEVKDNSVKVSVEKCLSFLPDMYRCSIAISVCYKDIPLYGFASVFVFKLLGGKFRSVLPSNLIYPGAFAKGYIPAKGHKYASNAVKQKLTLLGKKYGCHSCGKRWSTSFVGDHMPPNKLVRKGQRQRFYPQCTSCSNLQGAALSSMSRKLRVKTHGSSLRLYHLWLPLTIPLALLRNHIGDKSELQDSNTGCEKQSEDVQGPDEYLYKLVKKTMSFLKLNDTGDNGDED